MVNDNIFPGNSWPLSTTIAPPFYSLISRGVGIGEVPLDSHDTYLCIHCILYAHVLQQKVRLKSI